MTLEMRFEFPNNKTHTHMEFTFNGVRFFGW